MNKATNLHNTINPEEFYPSLQNSYSIFIVTSQGDRI